MWERFGGAAAAKQGIFRISRGQDPPPIPFQTVSAARASQWQSLKSLLNAAGGQQLKAVIGGDSAPLRQGQQHRLAAELPPLWLVAVP